MKDCPFTFGVKHTVYNAEMRKRRIEKGLTQQQLSKLCGLSLQIIGQIEGFRKYPGDDRADLIASALGCETEVVFPKWLKPFMIEKSSFNTESVITEKLLPNITEILQLPSSIDDAEEKIDSFLLGKEVCNLLKTLSLKEEKVLRLRFGINEETPYSRTAGRDSGGMTLEEVGYLFGTSRERIRQIEVKAIRKLQHQSKRRRLSSFIDINKKCPA